MYFIFFFFIIVLFLLLLLLLLHSAPSRIPTHRPEIRLELLLQETLVQSTGLTDKVKPQEI